MEWSSSWKIEQNDFSALGLVAENHTQELEIINNLNGSELRVHLNNKFGKKPLVFSSVLIAVNGGENIAITLNNKSEIAIKAGEETYSDSVNVKINAGDKIIIKTKLEKKAPVSGFSIIFLPLLAKVKTEGEIKSNNPEATAAFNQNLPNVGLLYGIDKVELLGQPVKQIAFFGDSITQMGFWSEALTSRLYKKLPGDFTTSNYGIAGNRLLHDSPEATNGTFGIAGVKRFESSIFENKSPNLVIVQIGVNDLCHPKGFALPNEEVSANELIGGFTILAELAHKHNAKILCSTILPFKGFADWDEKLENKRQLVNTWIRNNTIYDGYLDLDLYLRDSTEKEKMISFGHVGDWLHPSPAGGEIIANAVDLKQISDLF